MVWGHVFTDPATHGDAAWVRDNRFWKPTPEQPSFLAERIEPGRDVGQWEFA